MEEQKEPTADTSAKRLSTANTALQFSTTIWFAVALTGQWVFLYYIVNFYGASTLRGDFQDWTRNPFLRNAYVADDTIGNLSFAAHVLLAAIMAFGGVLQLVPQIRARAAFIHRWNGRLYVGTALIVSFAGLYLTWVRGDNPQDILGALSISLNAVLIIAFGILAWRSALAKHSALHQRWALRLFMVANAQWFFRIGVFAWIIVNQRPAGMTQAMNGPFDRLWAVGCFLLPLVLLEFYFRAKERGTAYAQFAMAGAVLAMTSLMGVGIVGLAGLMRQLL
jgi:hypothetical protein